MEKRLWYTYFVLVFISGASSVSPEFICQNNTRICTVKSEQCQCKQYYGIAEICFRVDLSSDLFFVEILSEEQASFYIRVSPYLKFETKPASCRLLHLPMRNYTVKVESITRHNDQECYCGGSMPLWCKSCAVQVTHVSNSDTWTVLTGARGPVPVVTAYTTATPQQITPLNIKESTIVSAVSSSISDYPRPNGIQPTYTQTPIAVAVSSCVVVCLVVILIILQYKGKLYVCFKAKSNEDNLSTKQEILSRPKSPITETSVILSTKSKYLQDDPRDSGFESVPACRCSILNHTYNGEDVDSVYDEKWGAFSIPKPVTYELDVGDGCKNTEIIKDSNPIKRPPLTGQIQQRPLKLPAGVHFCPPEDHSLVVSEEMLRINSAYMTSIDAEPYGHLPPIIERACDVNIRSCQRCRTNVNEHFQGQEQSSKTFDLLSLGGKSV